MRKSKIKAYEKKDLSPCPGYNNGIVDRLNKRLVEAKSGNYVLKIQSIGEQFKTWINYEYHSDVVVHIIDTNDVKRTNTDLLVPGLGPNGIELNRNRKIVPNNYFTWNDFEEFTFERLLRLQTTINEEGYYVRNKK